MYSINRVIFLFSTLLRVAVLSALGKKQSAQKVIFSRFDSLGGVYVKFLQLLAIRQDITIEEVDFYRDALKTFDRASYEPLNVEQLLVHELGPNALNSFSHIESRPFAAGSFGQVYGATLNDGSDVIIKCLRPSVVRHLKTDLRLLGLAARAIDSWMPKIMYNTRAIFTEFKELTLNETDYRRELAAAGNMHDRYAAHPNIMIPSCYASLSSKHVLVQERVHGLPLTQVMEYGKEASDFVREQLNSDLPSMMRLLALEYLYGSFESGATHGDPHPGNIYLLGDNKVALIDFGIMSKVESNVPALMNLIQTYSDLYSGNFDPSRIARNMLQYFAPDVTSAIYTAGIYYDKEELLEQVLNSLGEEAAVSLRNPDSHTEYLIENYKMIALFTEVVNQGNRFGLNISLSSPAFIRSLLLFLNLTSRLGLEKRDIVGSALDSVLENYRTHQSNAQSAAYDVLSIDKAHHFIAQWFERLSNNDPKLLYKLNQIIGAY